MKIEIEEFDGGFVTKIDGRIKVYDSTRLYTMFEEIIKKVFTKRVKVEEK